MPFVGVFENELRNAFSKLHAKNVIPKFSIHGPPVRRLLIECAETIDGYGGHEIGHGLVSQNLLLDHLAEMQLGKLLQMFCDNVSVSKIPAAVWNLKPFDRDELNELAEIGNASRPIWVYDYAAPKFVVNRIAGGELALLPISHGAKVAVAGATSTANGA